MEHLEGESLQERLEQGPLPMDQVLTMGIEIADALDKAHKSGVVHRDLKPGNIMLTAGGVKLLDFGLAKYQMPEADVSSASFSRMLTETPASAPLTVEGTILGTFQYMSPEQIDGTEADARSDIFSLGAVLYEMATGKKAFAGKTQASLIGSIMHSAPEPVSQAVPLAPPAFDRVIQTCLSKDPDERWSNAHDLKLQLQWLAEGGSQVGIPAPVSAKRKNRERLAWAVAALALVATGLFALLWAQRAPKPPRVVRFEMGYPEGLPVIDSPKLSPDGRHLAYNAIDEQGTSQIWIRPLNGLEAQLLPGTEGTGRPFWSPDSQYLGFFSGGKLKKIPVSGGPAQTICDAPTGADGSWSEGGVILYDGTGTDPINRVSAGGGIPTPEIAPNEEEGDLQVGWPQFLPHSDRFLWVSFEGSEPAVKISTLGSGESATVLPGQSRVEYAPPGFLLYVRENTLVAQPFDAEAGEITGDPVPLAEDLGIDAVGLAHFSASHNGTLAYRGGEAGGGQMRWTDLEGETQGLEGDPGDIGVTSLSKDGRWLALTLSGGPSGADDIWIRDLVRGVTSRFTFSDDDDSDPRWSPDGSRIVYTSKHEGQDNLFVKAVGGTGQPGLLIASEQAQFPSDWSSDGRYLLLYNRSPETGWDIHSLDMEAPEGGTTPYLASQFMEVRARFSPDARWVAYQSNESGRSEIYVQAFPGPGGKWQISTEGGSEPQWHPDGRSLYYVAPDTSMMRVDVETGESFEAGIPESVFAVTLRPVTQDSRYWVAPDGERFLLLGSLQGESTPPTTLVLNWHAELE
jgi:Tol biopolymer transport system component